MFHTSRLILRGYRASDEAFFLDLFDTYDVLVYLTSEYIAPSTGTHRARLDKMMKCALFLVVEDMETHERMGFALVDVAAPRHLDGEVGMALAQEWWGQGFATEIMEWLIGYSFRGLGCVACPSSPFLQYACDCFIRESGRKREAEWKEGKWVDHVWMGLLSKEYTAPVHLLQNIAPCQWCVLPYLL
ncbi:acyl-CoA N-acyltransferase [Pholiota molesta]|nr:acyl-CoA N-acyltransferase [Pholiota molesta]